MVKHRIDAIKKPLGKLEKCRVLDTGIQGFGECVQWGPVNCAHALPFGYCFLCMHPRVEEIIENTRKVLRAEKVA